MYSQVKLSQEQAREIAYELYDFIIQGIKEKEEKKAKEVDTDVKIVA